MKRFLFAGAAAIGLLASGQVFAGNDAAFSSTASQVMSADARAGFTIGARIPDNVELLAVPEEAYANSPELQRYGFFRWKDYVVFVDPASRRIVGVIE